MEKNFLSTNIKFLRISRNIKQDELAELVGKNRSLISQWESGSKEITVRDIIKLSNFFNVSMQDLVGKDLRLKQDQTSVEKKLDEFATKNGVKIYIDKDGEMTAEDVLEAQEYLRKIQTGEIDKNK